MIIADSPGAVNAAAAGLAGTIHGASSAPRLPRRGRVGKEAGRGERIRTSGLYVPNVALYRAKLHPDGSVFEAARDSGECRVGCCKQGR